jgi:sucrose-6-phosphate hydrolase SacC (GH32 family)
MQEISFGLEVLGDAGRPSNRSSGERTLVGYDMKASAGLIDRTQASLRPAAPPVFKDILSAPMPIESNRTTMGMTVFVDGRVIEAYLDDGRRVSHAASDLPPPARSLFFSFSCWCMQALSSVLGVCLCILT